MWLLRNDGRPSTYKKDSPKAALAMTHHGMGRHISPPRCPPYPGMKTAGEANHALRSVFIKIQLS
ncbi:hypothetical protein DESPIG_00413 [Desulfovibrio piger ATCC 29098]|uniref:Uncharacterized protein n=1 Tax=Desulfovibrio piger ATCC 29098 TaxID=411464 RepID=B6WQT4_9BACT|nr:hypothetical protein DESPIG_00413 [Desulfovibrio piger ATCC 29098]